VGAVPYAELPGWLQGMDVLLMPYVLTEHTRHIFPLKVHEYLATGRPVVSTALPAIADLAAFLPQAADARAFADAVVRALAQPEHGREARLERARAHTWDERVGRIEALLAGALGAKSTATP
jgi:glycosyltransferase involved in cell wall biosynthesis